MKNEWKYYLEKLCFQEATKENKINKHKKKHS